MGKYRRFAIFGLLMSLMIFAIFRMRGPSQAKEREPRDHENNSKRWVNAIDFVEGEIREEADAGDVNVRRNIDSVQGSTEDSQKSAAGDLATGTSDTNNINKMPTWDKSYWQKKPSQPSYNIYSSRKSVSSPSLSSPSSLPSRPASSLSPLLATMPLPYIIPADKSMETCGISERVNNVHFRLRGYPKSGTTWTEYIFNRLFKRFCDVDSRIECNAYTYADGISLTSVPCNTHVRFSVKGKHDSINLSWYDRGVQILLIIRDPRDVLVSYFYHLGYAITKKYTMESFFVAKFDEILAYITKNFNNCPRDKCLPIYYEELHRDGLDYLRQITNFMGVNATDQLLTEIQEDSSFDKQKERELKNLINKGNVPFLKNVQVSENISDKEWEHLTVRTRKGQIGQYLDELSPKLQNIALEKMKANLPRSLVERYIQ